MDITHIQPRDEKGHFVPLKYVAVVGLDYVSSSTGKAIRVEPGEVVEELSQKSLDEELRAGNIAVAPEDDKLGLEPVGLVEYTPEELAALDEDEQNGEEQ